MFVKEYLYIALSSISVYIFIIASIRLFGKRELSQLSVTDLVFILLISNAVQNAMVGANSTLSGGLVAAGSLFIANHILNLLLYRFPQFEHLVQGEASMIIYNGKVNKKNLDRAKITLEELKEAVREHGVALLEDVDLAVLEADGNISIISNDYKNRTTKKRVPRKLNKNKQS